MLHLPCRFRQILKKIVDTKQSMGKTMRESAFALTEAKYAAGEFRHTVFDSVETVGFPKLAIDLAFIHEIPCKCSAVLLHFPHDCPLSQELCDMSADLSQTRCAARVARPADAR